MWWHGDNNLTYHLPAPASTFGLESEISRVPAYRRPQTSHTFPEQPCSRQVTWCSTSLDLRKVFWLFTTLIYFLMIQKYFYEELSPRYTNGDAPGGKILSVKCVPRRKKWTFPAIFTAIISRVISKRLKLFIHILNILQTDLTVFGDDCLAWMR